MKTRHAILEWDIKERRWRIICESDSSNAKRRLRIRYELLCVQYPNSSFKLVSLAETAIAERVVHRDAEFRDMDHRDSVCAECATEMGYEPDDKEAGVWLGRCDFCGKEEPLTSLAHDWHKAKEVRDGE